MKKSFLASTLLSILLLCIMTVDSKAASSENPLDEIAWLVGGTWVAESKTPEASPVTTEAAFDWASHKKAILYSIVRKYENKTVPTLEGVCAWHPGKKQLVLLEVDNEGNLTESIVTVYGTKVSYEELIYQASGTTQPVRAQTTREGEDAFIFSASVPQEGEWRDVFLARYKRVK